ncbi:adaptor protein MecA [Bacillus sp. 2205SS5-2]|uniref:adaptor protein MecA n=1 Tax=Bacillus sp. 2205SS5-2 TaxID=3109031 RepID=UPI00300778CD
MKLERIKQNQIRFSISMEELEQKGLLQDELLSESVGWHELFEELMETASEQFGGEWKEVVTVEILSLTNDELILLFTVESLDDFDFRENIEEIGSSTRKDHPEIIVRLLSFEEVVNVAHRLNVFQNMKSELYSHEGLFYLAIILLDISLEGSEALLKEYGELETLTKEYLSEYGNKIISENAAATVCTYFQRF